MLPWWKGPQELDPNGQTDEGDIRIKIKSFNPVDDTHQKIIKPSRCVGCFEEGIS